MSNGIDAFCISLRHLDMGIPKAECNEETVELFG
jgi:hypothetical protein